MANHVVMDATGLNNTFFQHIKKSPSAQGLVDGERESSERCKDEIICTEKDLNGPKICGTNGKTYQNPCELNKIVCYGIPVEMHAMGDCQAASRCPLEREFQLNLIKSNATRYANEFVPMCNKTTSYYANAQCHTIIGYCWCSTIHGTPIPSTSVEISAEKMPNCKHLHAIHVNIGQKAEQLDVIDPECGHVERIIFNSNMMDVYRREYQNVPDEHSNHPGDEKNEALERRILVWRFNKLDLDEDGKLSIEELTSEHRGVILIVKPAACARTFLRHCDKNIDKMLDLQEWVNCLKIDFSGNVFPVQNDDNSLQYEVDSSRSKQRIIPPHTSNADSENESHDDFDLFLGSPAKKSTLSSSTESAVPAKLDCKSTKDKIIQTTSIQLLNTVFVPKCVGDKDNFFSEIQCHQKIGKKVCWCVHPVTGDPLNNGLVTSSDECHQKPLIVSSYKNPQSIKGCLPKKQLPFYHKLFKMIEREMRQSTVTPNPSQKRRRPLIAKWKFDQLDINGDNEIDKSEWTMFRKLLRNMKNFRKCGRNFVRFCDINHNKRISRKEWMHCTIQTYRKLKKARINPFLTLLNPLN